MFLFSFTKKPVNKTVSDSYSIHSNSKIKNLKIAENASRLLCIKKTELKSARQSLQSSRELLGTPVSLKQASE